MAQIHVWGCGCFVEFDPRGSASHQREGGVQPSAAQQGHAQPQAPEATEPAAVPWPAAVPSSSEDEGLPLLRPLVWFKFFTQAEAEVSPLAASVHETSAGVHHTLPALFWKAARCTSPRLATDGVAVAPHP